MDTENISTTAEAEAEGMADETFDALWDDDGPVSIEPESGGEEATDEPEDSEAGQPSEDAGEQENEAETEKESGDEPKAGQPTDVFEFKYLDGTRKVDMRSDEAKELVQKGSNYDKVRDERDSLRAENSGLRETQGQLRAYELFFKDLTGTDKPTAETIDNTRAQLAVNRAKTEGRELSLEDALAAAKKEREEYSAADTALMQKDKAAKAADDAERRRQSLNEFLTSEYKDVKAESIPQSVWDAFNSGVPLTYAYAKYENAQLKAQLQDIKKEQENRARSTGSRKSAGGSSSMSAFDAAWYNGD